MFNINHLKGGASHVCTRLPISSLPYPLFIYEYAREYPEDPYLLTVKKVQNPDFSRITEFYFEDSENRVSLLIRKIPPAALCADSSLIRIFELDDVGTKIVVHMPEAQFVALSSLRWSEREKETGAYLVIEATAPDEWTWTPATVEYVWPDQLKTAATS